MVVIPDLIPVLNAVLCLVIVILGVLVYTKKGATAALLIGFAFGLFGISHIYTILGLGSSWESAMITVRTSGYILVVAALYISLNRTKGRTEPA
jgi:dipeptide/tripeptide permease